jgi:hypothetical protein
VRNPAAKHCGFFLMNYLLLDLRHAGRMLVKNLSATTVGVHAGVGHRRHDGHLQRRLS